MRCLERNKVPFYYCTFIEKTAVLDPEGFETGESKVTYSEPVKILGNVSVSKGEAQIEQFGTSLTYDKVIIVEGRDCPIDENTVLFVDRPPTFDNKGNPLFDYIVKRVAKTKHSGISYAVEKVR